jgi:hypothetical protein
MTGNDRETPGTAVLVPLFSDQFEYTNDLHLPEKYTQDRLARYCSAPWVCQQPRQSEYGSPWRVWNVRPVRR